MTDDRSSSVVPKRRFPGFQDAPGWPRRLMGRYLRESRIKGTGGHEAKKLTVKLWGKGVFEKHEGVQGSENTQYYRRRAGQFIYSKLDFLNQAFGIIPEHLDGFESTVDLPCFDISPELNARFLLEYVQREQFYKTRGEIADGGRKAKRIQVETFLECPIYFPSKAEQQKIADCLHSLDDLIAAEGRKLEAMRQHKQGLMQQLFPQPGETRPRLRFPEFEDAPDWEEVTLGTLLDRPPDYGVNAAAVPFSESLPTYIRITDINDDSQFASRARVSVDIDATDEQYLEDGDIVLARTGASVGKSYRYRKEDGRLVYAGFLIRVRPNPERLLSQFLAAYLSTWSYWDWVRLTSARSGQPGINATEYASIPLLLPPDRRTLVEQQKIADCLTSIDDQLSAQTRKLDTLKQHKQGLLQQLFLPLESQ